MSLVPSARWKFYALLLAALAGPTLGSAAEEAIPLYEGFGTHHREVTTTSPEAQAYFDQGLNLAYAFGRRESVRSFRAALELDPSCARLLIVLQ